MVGFYTIDTARLRFMEAVLEALIQPPASGAKALQLQAPVLNMEAPK